MCRVLWAILEFCSRESEGGPKDAGAFDRDELGIDPEDDYDLYEED